MCFDKSKKTKLLFQVSNLFRVLSLRDYNKRIQNGTGRPESREHFTLLWIMSLSHEQCVIVSFLY